MFDARMERMGKICGKSHSPPWCVMMVSGVEGAGVGEEGEGWRKGK